MAREWDHLAAACSLWSASPRDGEPAESADVAVLNGDGPLTGPWIPDRPPAFPDLQRVPFPTDRPIRNWQAVPLPRAPWPADLGDPLPIDIAIEPIRCKVLDPAGQEPLWRFQPLPVPEVAAEVLPMHPRIWRRPLNVVERRTVGRCAPATDLRPIEADRSGTDQLITMKPAEVAVATRSAMQIPSMPSSFPAQLDGCSAVDPKPLPITLTVKSRGVRLVVPRNRVRIPAPRPL
jgi:hypothetical protein